MTATGDADLARNGTNSGFAEAGATGTIRMTLRYTIWEEKRPRAKPGPLMSNVNQRLLERGVDRRELAVQVAAKAVDDGDNGKRDAGGDEAVFNGGSAGLVLHLTRVLFF